MQDMRCQNHCKHLKHDARCGPEHSKGGKRDRQFDHSADDMEVLSKQAYASLLLTVIQICALFMGYASARRRRQRNAEANRAQNSSAPANLVCEWLDPPRLARLRPFIRDDLSRKETFANWSVAALIVLGVGGNKWR